jgi:hypothetical protein
MDDIELVSLLSIEKDLTSVMYVLRLMRIHPLSSMREFDRMAEGAPLGAEVDSFTYGTDLLPEGNGHDGGGK